uniref:Uncharacterized protein n=1 Tax=Anguilla anguilla TaxID=7936 RepID=A0A0E9PVN8_ANGAN
MRHLKLHFVSICIEKQKFRFLSSSTDYTQNQKCTAGILCPYFQLPSSLYVRMYQVTDKYFKHRCDTVRM